VIAAERSDQLNIDIRLHEVLGVFRLTPPDALPLPAL